MTAPLTDFRTGSPDGTSPGIRTPSFFAYKLGQRPEGSSPVSCVGHLLQPLRGAARLSNSRSPTMDPSTPPLRLILRRAPGFFLDGGVK